MAFDINKLTPDQRRAFDAVLEGKSVFLTGPGGTGKSYLLRMIYELLPELTGKHIAVCAMTGCASLLLGRFSKTLHSWAGVGLAREPALSLVAQIRRSGKCFRRWLGTDVLVIDEVSMLTPELLEKLNEIAKILRRDNRPMGGMQVIFVGDFFQLPPVMKNEDTVFAFESPAWKEIVQETIELETILRQTDPIFHQILNEARYGVLSKESKEILDARANQSWRDLQIRPTLLFTRRAEVDMVNERNLKALTTEKRIFKAETVFAPIEFTKYLTSDSPNVKKTIEKMDKEGPYMAELILAIGAQVMLLVNSDYEKGLVNGSRGVVVGFDTSGAPLVQFLHGDPIPVAAHSWESEEIDGVFRKQIPLRLAYAITIHKSQGATLDCALIDIGTSTFEYGQAYVALSRVKSLESLYVWDVEPTAFRAHPKVLKFYESLHHDA